MSLTRVAIPAPAGHRFAPDVELVVDAAPLTWQGVEIGRFVELVGITDDGLFAVVDVEVTAPELFTQAFTPTQIPDVANPRKDQDDHPS